VPGSLEIFLGYRAEQLFLADEMEVFGDVYLATEDGSAGVRGNVLDALETGGGVAEIIMACGPLPMLRAVKAHAITHEIKAYLSLEERMACGVGACLGCVCRTTKKDEHSQVNNARICTEGPVFAAEDVDI
jgi:dihydroorotate dehydrogenase electron transfer subunit